MTLKALGMKVVIERMDQQKKDWYLWLPFSLPSFNPLEAHFSTIQEIEKKINGYAPFKQISY